MSVHTHSTLMQYIHVHVRTLSLGTDLLSLSELMSGKRGRTALGRSFGYTGLPWRRDEAK